MEFFLQIIANSLVLGTQVLFLALSLYLIKAVSKIEHVALSLIHISEPTRPERISVEVVWV